MRLTEQELMLAVAFALMGFIFSGRSFLLYMAGLNPLQGLIIYYIILWGCLYILSRLDLVVFGFKIKSVTQTVGLLLITFAFFTIVNWESPYVQMVTGYDVNNASPVFYQAEDGAVWYLWSQAFPWADIETIRILTFVFTPAFLAVIGGLLASEKVRIGP